MTRSRSTSSASAPVALRLVCAGDAAALREVRLRALADCPDAFATTLQQEAALPAVHWDELARQSEIGDHLAVYVAVAATAPDRPWLGMGAGRWFDRDRGIAQLWGMWVDPAARRHRVGEGLVSQVHGWAAAAGARFLRLGVVVRDGDATGFYERLGFRPTGEVRPMTRDPSLTASFMIRPV